MEGERKIKRAKEQEKRGDTCLDTLMKHEARVVDMTSQSRIINNR